MQGRYRKMHTCKTNARIREETRTCRTIIQNLHKNRYMQKSAKCKQIHTWKKYAKNMPKIYKQIHKIYVQSNHTKRYTKMKVRCTNKLMQNTCTNARKNIFNNEGKIYEQVYTKYMDKCTEGYIQKMYAKCV